MSKSTPLVLLLLGCPGAETDPPTPPPPADAVWYTTCGDPVCSGYSGPYPGVDPCTTEAEGDVCTPEGAECDFGSECNARLVCAAEDPKDQPGGCPISKASAKRDITYLDPTGIDRAAQEALSVRLATWSYTWEPPSTPRHLGFVIDDQRRAPRSGRTTAWICTGTPASRSRRPRHSRPRSIACPVRSSS